MYRELKPNERIEAGDEWYVDCNIRWYKCKDSIGYTVYEWGKNFLVDWRVRRKINKTKLGNIL